MNLTGKILLAMPQVNDQRFHKAVIYICGHDANGAMGLVINKYVRAIKLQDLLKQLNIPYNNLKEPIPMNFGGPLEVGRGFVLHTNDFQLEGTIAIRDNMALTATIDILKAIVSGQGPQRYLLALGYSGWTAGQLEAEIMDNGWEVIEPDQELIFSHDNDLKWEKGFAKIGANAQMLSSSFGHA